MLSIVNPHSLQMGTVVARVKVTDHDSDQITYQIESSSSFVPVSLMFYKLHVLCIIFKKYENKISVIIGFAKSSRWFQLLCDSKERRSRLD